jgi:hypothetical protein
MKAADHLLAKAPLRGTANVRHLFARMSNPLSADSPGLNLP